MFRICCRVALVIGLLLSPSMAEAQSMRPGRPYRGLFASGMGDLGHRLSATASLMTGYDDNLLAEARGTSTATIGDAQPVRGSLTLGVASLTYAFTAGTLSVNVNGGSSVRYYPSLRNEFLQTTAANANISYSIALRPSTSLSMSALATYRPYLMDASFLVAEEPIAVEAPIDPLDLPYRADSYLSHTETVGLSHRLGRRTMVEGRFQNRGADGVGGFGRRQAGVRLTHTISQGFDLRAGYGYSVATYDNGSKLPLHTIDAGVNYHRSLSISRRTTLSFGTGSAATQRSDRLHFTFTGNVQLAHEIGRSWTTWIGYGRRLILNEVVDEPLTSDGVTAGISGLISRSVQFSAVARGALGTVGYGSDAADAPGFDTVYASAMLAYAMNRYVNLFASYGLYRHNFEDGVTLRADVPQAASRQGARFGVTVWAPILKGQRRADAPR
jgi:hypothetical protein